MTHKITQRVSRIITGSIHSLIDAVEDKAPVTVMEQAIREVDAAIASVRQQLGKVMVAKHMATKRLTEKNTKHEELSVHIETAILEKRDDLAQVGVAAQLDIEAQIPVIERSVVDSTEQEKELEGYIVALQAKKRELRDELKAFQQQQASTPLHADHAVQTAKSVFDRFITLDLDTKDASRLNELEQLSVNNRVQERLATIKAQLSE